MNRLEKAAAFGAMMGKQAGLFWKKLDQPVGIKSQWGPHNGVTEMRLDAERTMEPRLLTRLFSSPEKDYDHLFSVMKDMAEHEDSELSSTPMGRAMFASHLLPKWYPDRYKQEGDSPIGNEDVFEDSVYPAFSSQLKAPPTTPMTAKKAAAFGGLTGAGIGALVGGGGTALYDYLAGTEKGNLRRALTGAGVGGLAGGLLGHAAHKAILKAEWEETKRRDIADVAQRNEEYEDSEKQRIRLIQTAFTPDPDAPHLSVNTPYEHEIIAHPRMMHPTIYAGAGQKLITNEEARAMDESLKENPLSRAIGENTLMSLFDDARLKGFDAYKFNHGDTRFNSGATKQLKSYFDDSKSKGESFPGRNTIPYGNVAENGPNVFSLVGKDIPNIRHSHFKDFNK